MRSKIKQLFIFYLLSVTLLFTTGMCFGIKTYNDDSAQPSQAKEDDFKVSFADFTKLSFIYQPPYNASIGRAKHYEAELQNSAQTIEKVQIKEEPAQIKSDLAIYEVTSYYLNVRSNANDTSDIIEVVSQGTTLEVLNKTDNGWLALKLGGFVNGKYANLMQAAEEIMIPAAQSTVTSDSGRVPQEPTSMIKSDSGLTEASIEKIFKGTSLAGHGLESDILQVEAEFGINAYFTIAVMKLESAHGESRIAKDKNNLFGLNAIDGNEYNKALSFKTMGESVQKFGQLIADNYIGEGYTTVEKVSNKYCQANPKWAGLVMRIMKGDYHKL